MASNSHATQTSDWSEIDRSVGSHLSRPVLVQTHLELTSSVWIYARPGPMAHLFEQVRRKLSDI